MRFVAILVSSLGFGHEGCSYNLGSGHADCSYNLGVVMRTVVII